MIPINIAKIWLILLCGKNVAYLGYSSRAIDD